jgi:predicted DNA-binding transcriptional regulator AlpA
VRRADCEVAMSIYKTEAVSEPLLIAAKDVARHMQVSLRTVWRTRSAGQMPPPVRIGAAVRWRLDEIRKWISDGCPKCTARDNERSRR